MRVVAAYLNSFLPVSEGTPQESILGIGLFISFINDVSLPFVNVKFVFMQMILFYTVVLLFIQPFRNDIYLQLIARYHYVMQIGNANKVLSRSRDMVICMSLL